TAFKWPHEAILILMEEYRLRQKDFISGKMSQKKIWLLIAAKMLKHGYKVSGLQCVSKFSGLKRTYKAVKSHNKKIDIKLNWIFFKLMDDLLGKSSMSSVTTVSSTGKRSQIESVCSSSGSDKEEDIIRPNKKIRQIAPVEKLIEDLRNMRKVTEEAQERRHKENIELRRRLLNSFDKMLNILEKK
ncbi:hypothetical protein ALC62_13200, partial [Cyphomyrmex costatus]